jgi:hypothetical protein
METAFALFVQFYTDGQQPNFFLVRFRASLDISIAVQRIRPTLSSYRQFINNDKQTRENLRAE